MTGTDLDKAKAITGGVNFILGKSVAEHDLPDNEKTQNIYIKEALLLKQALRCAVAWWMRKRVLKQRSLNLLGQ